MQRQYLLIKEGLRSFPRMLTFLKAQAAALIATAVDFLVTIFLREGLGIWYLIAGVTGTIFGGVVNFLLGRNWAFAATDKSARGQVFKYLVVWLGNLALNAGGLYLFTSIAGIEYKISKVMVSLIVGIGYNYVFQRFFVFKK